MNALDHSQTSTTPTSKKEAMIRTRTTLMQKTLTTIAVLTGTAAIALASCSSSADDGTKPTDQAAISTVTSAELTARPTVDVDEMFVVDGSRMHLTCQGAGDRTVVLVAGFGSAGDAWDPIVPQVAESARVCAYDRLGTGSSDNAAEPQTFETQAQALHGLLDVAAEPGPYVVVGHSFGGLVAATYASQHPDDVAGLLLLDASPVDWNATACAVPDLGTAGTDIWTATCAMQTDPAANPESLDGAAAFAEAATIDDLGSMPLIVDQAADEGYADQGLPDDVATHLTQVWDEGQERWASLSTNSELNRIPDTTHQVYLDQPAIVIDHIRTLVRD